MTGNMLVNIYRYYVQLSAKSLVSVYFPTGSQLGYDNHYSFSYTIFELMPYNEKNDRLNIFCAKDAILIQIDDGIFYTA